MIILRNATHKSQPRAVSLFLAVKVSNGAVDVWTTSQLIALHNITQLPHSISLPDLFRLDLEIWGAGPRPLDSRCYTHSLSTVLYCAVLRCATNRYPRWDPILSTRSQAVIELAALGFLSGAPESGLQSPSALGSRRLLETCWTVQPTESFNGGSEFRIDGRVSWNCTNELYFLGLEHVHRGSFFS